MTDRMVTPAEALAAERAGDRALGFWIYLMTDAIIFALLFATYAVMVDATAGGPTGPELFSLGRAFAETMILLASSTVFAFATLAARLGQRRTALLLMGVTVLLGLAFLGLELSEFVGLVDQGASPQRSGFLSAFFGLVGTHGLHVLAGIVSIAVVAGQVATRGLQPAVTARLVRVGMFWHFLDLAWIGIFSFVYLPGLIP